MANEVSNRSNPAYLAQLERVRVLQRAADGAALAAQAQGGTPWEDPAFYAIQQALEDAGRQLDALADKTPVSMDMAGMRGLGKARQYAGQALEGLSPTGQFLGSTAMSIGQNAAILPTAVLGPAAPLTIMGGIAAADKMYDVTASGGSAGEALGRGVGAGLTEGATEKLPLEFLVDLVKTGGKSAVRNLLRQAGIEATEEGLSYAANFLADKAAGDPNARFDAGELLRSAAAGGLSGAFFGGVGSLTGRAYGLPTGAERSALEVQTDPWALPTGRESIGQAGPTGLRVTEYNAPEQALNKDGRALYGYKTGYELPTGREPTHFTEQLDPRGLYTLAEFDARQKAQAGRKRPDLWRLPTGREPGSPVPVDSERTGQYDRGSKSLQGGLKYGRAGETAGGEALVGADTQRAGVPVLWSALQGAGRGVQAKAEGSTAFVGRAAAEGKTVGRIGDVSYAYRVTPMEQYRPETRRALEAYHDFGIEPMIVDSFERNTDNLTITSTDALTGPDGTVYLLNGSTIDGRNSAGHEGLHAALRRSLQSAKDFTALVGAHVDMMNKEVSKYLSAIEDTYFEQSKGVFDPKQHMDHLEEEFTAFLSGAMNDGTARDLFGGAVEDFDALEAAWARMKADMAAGGPQQAAEGGGPIRDIFAGVKAKTADIDALTRAIQMEESGKSALEIWRETGWGRGADRQWRFWIDDSGMTYLGKGSTVGESIHHPALYEAYPGIPNMVFEKAALEKNVNAEFIPRESKIRINSTSDSKRDPKDSALHELQHVVQELEGFAKGGSYKQAGLALFNRTFADVINLPEFRKLRSKEEMYDYIRQYILRSQARKEGDKVLYQAYFNLAGEREAEHTVTRQTYNSEDLLNDPPEADSIPVVVTNWEDEIKKYKNNLGMMEVLLAIRNGTL